MSAHLNNGDVSIQFKDLSSDLRYTILRRINCLRIENKSNDEVECK